MTDAAPRGPAEVRAALLDAALDLYASGAPFSARRVARLAGVNHGQVHHLFGGKAGLEQAMVEHLAQAQADALPDSDDPAVLLPAAARIALSDPRFVRVLARVLLERDPDAPLPQRQFPVVQRLQAALAAHDLDPDLLAGGLAAALGFSLFEPWITAAVGRAVDPLALAAPHLAAALRGPGPR